MYTLSSYGTTFNPTLNLYFGGKLMRSAGVTVATDRLGSVRANSNSERMNYWPNGQERTSTADGREKFGTYFRDASSYGYTAPDYADQRYYNATYGRFWTPDPYRASPSGWILSDPGSWNRYAYVGNDPINFVDPTGLDKCQFDNSDLPCFAVTTTSSPGGGGGGGGVNRPQLPMPVPDPPTEDCPPIPLAPKGFSIDDNIQLAKLIHSEDAQNGSGIIGDLAWF
jgi:RHS repeat-associated protein